MQILKMGFAWNSEKEENNDEIGNSDMETVHQIFQVAE